MNNTDPFEPVITPLDQRNKIRNACISGHMPGQEKVCPHCRRARFNRITTGYYLDCPSVDMVTNTLAWLREQCLMDEYIFVLEFLGLPVLTGHQEIDLFFHRLRKLEMVSRWSKGQPVSRYTAHPLLGRLIPLPPLTPGLVQNTVLLDPYLTEVYRKALKSSADNPVDVRYLENMGIDWMPGKPSRVDPYQAMHNHITESAYRSVLSGKTRMALEVMDTRLKLINSQAFERLVPIFRNAFKGITVDSLSQVSIMDNRQTRRDKVTIAKQEAGYVVKQSPKPHKRGDKNGQQLVKDVKPHPLLKGLFKKAES